MSLENKTNYVISEGPEGVFRLTSQPPNACHTTLYALVSIEHKDGFNVIIDEVSNRKLVGVNRPAMPDRPDVIDGESKRKALDYILTMLDQLKKEGDEVTEYLSSKPTKRPSGLVRSREEDVPQL